jgi:thioredoxin:protein disulfide reductase
MLLFTQVWRSCVRVILLLVWFAALTVPAVAAAQERPRGGLDLLASEGGAAAPDSRGGGLIQRIFGTAAQPGLLPPEQAFPLAVRSVAKDVLVVRFETAPGYYLYRERMDFGSAAAVLPEGAIIDDPNFGAMEVYREPLEAYVQLASPLLAGDGFTVGFQGCSDSGLCYPPMRVRFVVDGSGGWVPADGGDPGVASPRGDVAGGLSGLAVGVFPDGAVFPVLLAFFFAGIGLSLTACMYPLVPILSGLIAGDQRRTAPRAFWLSFVFVQATAVTYALAGVAAGLSGAAVQAYLQHPLVLAGFAGLFVVMALAMFGLMTVQVPVAIQSQLDGLARRQRGGRLIGVAVMGVLSALIVGACSGPALIAALAFISNTGDAWFGGLALFVMANGMGVPLLLVGTAFGRWLPGSGAWMNRVRQGFGFVFLAVAVWMLGRLLDPSLTLALWGLLLFGVGGWLALAVGRPWRRRPLLQVRRLAQASALAVSVWGVLLLGGAAVGGYDPLAPMANLDSRQRDHVAVVWERVGTPAALERRLAEARSAARPVVIDVYADWCVYCVQLERQTFSDPAVIAALDRAVRLKIDVTAMSADDRALLRRLQVFLPPAVLFVDADGQERTGLRLNGFVPAERFVEVAQAAIGADQALVGGELR